MFISDCGDCALWRYGLNGTKNRDWRSRAGSTAAGGLTLVASGAAEPSRACDMETGFFRRLGLVQHGAQAGTAKSLLRLSRFARTIRHRRIMGRLREFGDSIRLHAAAHRDALAARRADRAIPYRARGDR